MKRFRSIDILRGFCMVFVLGMDQVLRKAALLSNNSVLQFLSNQMRHSEFGAMITFEDFLLPTLVFITGVTIPTSLNKHVNKAWIYKLLYISRRMVFLLLISFIYNAYINKSLGLNTLTIAGVLSIFAVAWGGASIIYLLLYDAFNCNIKKLIISLGVSAVVIQVLYSIITIILHAPDFPSASVFSAEGNIVCYIDRLYYPKELLINGLFYRCAVAYFSSISMAVIGIIIGILLYRIKDEKWKILNIIIGLLMIVSGILLRHVYPINKRLWSPTFILIVAGIDILVLYFLNFICDSKGSRHKYLVESFGHNTILLYILEESGIFQQIGIVLFSFIFTIFHIDGVFYEQLAEFVIICFAAFYLTKKNIKINI